MHSKAKSIIKEKKYMKQYNELYNQETLSFRHYE